VRALLGELLLISTFVLLYGGVRALTEGGEERALANARLLIRLESTARLGWERPLQDAALAHHPLVTLANWVYVWGFWPVIAAVAVLLFWKRRDSYRLLRNALFISGAIGFAFFALQWLRRGWPTRPWSTRSRPTRARTERSTRTLPSSTSTPPSPACTWGGLSSWASASCG
jgi:hypothetical protein